MKDSIDFASLLHSSARKAAGRVRNCKADIVRLEGELERTKSYLEYALDEQRNIDAFVETYTAPARAYHDAMRDDGESSPSMLNDIGVSAGRLDDIAIGRDVIMPDRKFTETAEVHFGTIAKDPR